MSYLHKLSLTVMAEPPQQTVDESMTQALAVNKSMWIDPRLLVDPRTVLVEVVVHSTAEKNTSESVAQKKSFADLTQPCCKIKKPRVARVNDTELCCPECEFHTRSVYSWLHHLRRKHITNPKLAGLVLRCECGHESQSETHVQACAIANFTVIRKTDGPIRRLDDEKNTFESVARKISFADLTPSHYKMKKPRMARANCVNDTELCCPECEFHTRSVYSWLHHLRRTHITNPKLAGLVLRCECGHESQSQAHMQACAISNFTVIRKTDGPIRRLDDEKVYPSTTSAYVHHLRKYHIATPNQCDRRQFTIHKRDAK